MNSLKLLLSAATISLALSSCCSTEQFEQRLNTYVNRPKIDVVEAFGSPIRSERFGDTELVTFLRDRTYFDSGTGPSTHVSKTKRKDGGYDYHTYVNPGTPAHYEYRTCEITFRIKRGTVISWSHNGNDCCD